MAPRGAALIPLLTFLGTTAAAAVLAQKYVPQYMANKHKKTRSVSDEQQPQVTKSATMASAVTKQEAVATQPTKKTAAEPPSAASSMVVAVLLQDSYMLISAFGVCIMVVAVLVSLALVAMRDDVASLNDLQMFPPLMLVAMGLISLGMVLSMLNPKPLPVLDEVEDEDGVAKREKAVAEADAEAIKKAAKESQGFLYEYYKNKYADQQTDETDEVDVDGKPKKRVSKCPFGF